MSDEAPNIDPAVPFNEGRAARRQMMLCSMVLLLLVLLTVIAQIGMRHGDLLLPGRLNEWHHTDGFFSDSQFFANPDERLLYQVMPAADYSHGGVYFTGASAMERALMLWDLPPETGAQIHNYCLSGQTHIKQDQFVRLLIEHENLLAAGADKTCIITELNLAAAEPEPAVVSNMLWRQFFTRYGLYTFDPANGPARVPLPAWEINLTLFQIRTHVFWSWALQSLQGNRETYLALSERHDVATNHKQWLYRLRARPEDAPFRWEDGMDSQLQHYADLLDYLIARHVRVAAVYMPNATWTHGFAPSIRYREKVLAIVASRGVPLLDLKDKVPDSGYADSTHLNYQGSSIIQPDLIAFAEKFRRQINGHP